MLAEIILDIITDAIVIFFPFPKKLRELRDDDSPKTGKQVALMAALFILNLIIIAAICLVVCLLFYFIFLQS